MKFTVEEKLKYVKAYKEHKYIPLDSKCRCDIDAWHERIKFWNKLFDKYGEQGLIHKKKNNKYSQSLKFKAINRVINGESYRSVAFALDINNDSLICNWMKSYKKYGLDGLKSKVKGRKSNGSKRERFEEEIEGIRERELSPYFGERLSKKIESLGGTRGAKPRQKYEAILEVKKEFKEAKLKELLEIAKLSKSTYFYEKHRDMLKEKEQEIKEQIKTIYYENKQRYGVRRITAILNANNLKINHKKVQRLMKQMDLKGLQSKVKYNSYHGTTGTIAPDLIIMEYKRKDGQIHHKSNFSCTGPNQKWTTDVSQFNFPWGKCYLSPIKDMFTSEIISYNLSLHPSLEQTFDMLNNAFKQYPSLNGLIFHSDQGWQYQHADYVSTLKDKGILQSMSRKGNCLDNCIMESFFARIKTEIYFGKENIYKNFEEFKDAVNNYINWYNNKRIKYYKTLKKWMTPSECRNIFASRHPNSTDLQ